MRGAASRFPSTHIVPNGWLIALLAAWLGLDQLLLWRFLDLPSWACIFGAVMVAVLCGAIVRCTPADKGPSPLTLLICCGIALLLLIFGGEGRFLYANIDWQVRFAVLRDLRINPWPFVYETGAAQDLLRAPIGMFLLPAVAGKAGGAVVADLALLGQNAVLMGIVMALGSTLFDTQRGRILALMVFIAFSGMDALGRLLFRGGLSDHIENWSYLQYSSTLTLMFWVPQHALAGWIGAAGFLLWRTGRAPLAPWLALLPLTALWSPLGLMGALPFAALAGISTLARRALRPADIALPALATLLSIPSLLYLAAGAAAGMGMGMEIGGAPLLQWALAILLEILIYALPLFFFARKGHFGLDTLIVATIWLLCVPFVRIGWSTDFMTRASIAALAVLALLVADALLTRPRLRPWLIAPLLVGMVTGWHEIRRAFVHPLAPAVRCNLVRIWDFEALELGFRKPDDPPSPKGTYLAPLANVPALVRPIAPHPAKADDPVRCWDGHWYHPDEQVS